MVKSTFKTLTLVSIAGAMLVGSQAQAMGPALEKAVKMIVRLSPAKTDLLGSKYDIGLAMSDIGLDVCASCKAKASGKPGPFTCFNHAACPTMSPVAAAQHATLVAQQQYLHRMWKQDGALLHERFQIGETLATNFARYLFKYTPGLAEKVGTTQRLDQKTAARIIAAAFPDKGISSDIATVCFQVDSLKLELLDPKSPEVIAEHAALIAAQQAMKSIEAQRSELVEKTEDVGEAAAIGFSKLLEQYSPNL